MSKAGFTHRGVLQVLLNRGRSYILLLICVPLLYVLGVKVISGYSSSASADKMTAQYEKERLARFVQALVPKKHEVAAAKNLQEEAEQAKMMPAANDGIDIIDPRYVVIANRPREEVEVAPENPWEAPINSKSSLLFMDRRTDHYINLMATPHPAYLPAYSNPCWVEHMFMMQPFTDSYFFNDNDKVRKQYFLGRESLWKDNYRHGNRHRLRCIPHLYVIGTPECDAPELLSNLVLQFRIIKGLLRKPDWWGGARFQYFRKEGENITRHFVPISHYLDLMDDAAMRINDYVRWSEGREFHSLVIGEASETALTEVPGWKGLPENLGRPDDQGPAFFEANYMYKVNPNAKIIFIFKQPTERLYLEYYHNKAFNHTPEDFHRRAVDAVREMEACLQKYVPWACVHNTTINNRIDIQLRRSMYHVFVRRWLEVFPVHQTFYIKTEEFRADPASWTNKALGFLGMGVLPVNAEKKASELPVKPEPDIGPMLPETKTLLDNFFALFNQRLTDLIQDKRFLWK